MSQQLQEAGLGSRYLDKYLKLMLLEMARWYPGLRKKTNIIFILSHIAYRKDQFICPVPWTHEELILKWDRETIMREKIQKKINQTFVTCFLYGAK